MLFLILFDLSFYCSRQRCFYLSLLICETYIINHLGDILLNHLFLALHVIIIIIIIHLCLPQKIEISVHCSPCQG